MSNTNIQNNTSNNSLLSFASRIWQHSQQIIKGFSLVTLGIISYSFLKPASKAAANVNETTASQSTDLTSINNGMAVQKSIESSNIISHSIFSGLTSSANNIAETFTSNELDIGYPDQKNYHVKKNVDSLENNNIKRGLLIQNPIGVTFPVNTVTIYNQRRSSVAAFNGSYVVVWDSEGEDGSVMGIIGQRFDNRGNKFNASFIANTRTIGSQISPTIAKLANENFIIGWTGDSYGFNEYITEIYSQVFNNTNEKLGIELRNNENTNGAQYEPKFVSFPNGKVLTAWISQNTNNRITYRLMDANANKIGVEQQLGMSATVDQLGFGCTVLPDNGFAIAWNVIDYGLSVHTSEIFLQAFDSSGNQYTYPFGVNNYQINQQIYPAITSLRNNKLAVSWISYGENDTNNGLYVRTYNTAGTPLTSDIKIDSQPFDISAGYNPLIAPLTAITTLQDSVTLWQRNSSFLIAWSNVKGVFGQLFDLNTSKIGRTFQISANFLNQQAYEPKVTELSDGNVIFTWTAPDDSGSGIFSRILVPDIMLFAYNLDIPKTYTEDTSYQFNDLVVNPMLDADAINATLILSNPLAGSLSLESSNNITASFDPSQGVWQVQNAGIVDLNRIFEQLKFTPSTNYNSDFTIQINLTDSNTNHTNYSNTLTMLGMPVNDVPALSTNQLALNQGETITLGLNNIDASDVDNALTDFSFKVDQLVQGQFENINNPGRGVTSFTYSQLANSEIRFIHDNTRFAPAYQISVSDGNLSATPQPATIDFNARPELVNNQFSIEGGQTVILSQDNLKASDDHTSVGDLMFVMNDINHGQFEIVSAPGATVSQFTQQQVIDGQVRFVHDGSAQAPSFKTSVNDGRISTDAVPVTVNFVANNSTSLTANDTLGLAIGVSIGGAALLAGAGIGIWQGKKRQQLRQERDQEPLANAIRTKLRVGNVDDFKSSQGRNYVNFINTLKNELINLGIETEQMLPDEINELAGYISNAIKDTMRENGIKLKKTITGAIELNTQTLQTYVSTIAAKTQEFKNDHPGFNTNGMGLKTLNPVNAV